MCGLDVHGLNDFHELMLWTASDAYSCIHKPWCYFLESPDLADSDQFISSNSVLVCDTVVSSHLKDGMPTG